MSYSDLKKKKEVLNCLHGFQLRAIVQLCQVTRCQQEASIGSSGAQISKLSLGSPFVCGAYHCPSIINE